MEVSVFILKKMYHVLMRSKNKQNPLSGYKCCKQTC